MSYELRWDRPRNVLSGRVLGDVENVIAWDW